MSRAQRPPWEPRRGHLPQAQGCQGRPLPKLPQTRTQSGGGVRSSRPRGVGRGAMRQPHVRGHRPRRDAGTSPESQALTILTLSPGSPACPVGPIVPGGPGRPWNQKRIRTGIQRFSHGATPRFRLASLGVAEMGPWEGGRQRAVSGPLFPTPCPQAPPTGLGRETDTHRGAFGARRPLHEHTLEEIRHSV